MYLLRYLTLTVLCIYAVFPLQAQSRKQNNKPTFSYEHNRVKVQLTESENQFVVEFEKNFDYSAIVRTYNLTCVYRPLADSALYHVHMAAKPIVFMGDTKKIKNLGFERASDLTDALRKQGGIVAAYPMVTAEDGTPQAYTNKVIIKLKQAFDNRNTQVILNDLGIQPDSWQPLLTPNSYTVLTKNNISAIDLTKRLEKNSFIDYAEPDFILFLKRLNDPLYPNQWSLNNLGTSSHPNGIPDADIDAPEAWAITKGNSNIKIAVLDEGVELSHPDLAANMLTGFDATGLGSGGQCNSSDSHGTACAGIIAAVDSNNIGIKGIAPRCKIVPVRIAYSGSGGWITDNSTIANAITWAYTTGNADILSNSWGGGVPSNLIIEAIENAVNLGRNGLGSIVLFSSGNDASPSVSYPAYTPHVIAVTSTSMCNERKSYNSCDGEDYWGANYGNDLDIAAPGVKITTTDNIGGGGYNPNGDYYATFNGTSSACPHAAGVMVLILSVNSNLTAMQARRIIEKSCDKVGGYAYQTQSNQLHGTWSFELGYGKVNAYKAVIQAQNNIFASFSTPQQVFTTTTATVPFTNLSENAVSYQWFFPGGTPSTSTELQPTVTYQGFGSYDVTLIATSVSGLKDTLHIPYYINLSDQVLMQNGSITACNAIFYDEGGVNGNYSNNSEQILTVNPAVAGSKVRVEFSSFNFQFSDYLQIYDGTSINAPLIGTYYYSPSTITATNATGALTFRFISDSDATSDGWVAQLSCYEPMPMVFQSIIATHSNTNPVRIGDENNQILRIAVNTSGGLNPLNLTQFNLNTNGSTNALTDISGARVYYTGKSTYFSTNTAFGTTFIDPNGTFSISGNQPLQTGINYFWLVYDIKSSAVAGNVVDAQLTSAVVASTNRTPINGNPVGSRTIFSHIAMQNGSITTCNALFYDEGGVDGTYLNNSNHILTINPAIAGNKVRVEFTTYVSLASSDFLYIYDGTSINAPLIAIYSQSFSFQMTITATNAAGALTFRFTSNSTGTSSGWVAQISCYQPAPMVFQSITATHPTVGTVGIGTNNNQMLRIAVNAAGELSPLNITQLNFSTEGSTNAATDISGVRLYYTATSDVFTTDNAFGTVVANPNGTFSAIGNKVLYEGANYFWFVYDIKNSALAGNVIDAQLTSAVIRDTTRTSVNGNPIGSRTIINQVFMKNGSITTCDAVFYDEGGADGDYLDNSNKVLTINPAIAGSKVRVQFMSLNLDYEYSHDVLYIYDGTSINASLIGIYDGSVLLTTITATNSAGALTFKFVSDDHDVYSGWVAQISCYEPVPMVFQSITATHSTTATVGIGSNNNQMLRIAVTTTGELTPLNLTLFNLSTNGSANASADISGARLYYTGNSSVFTINSPFGTVLTNPNGTFSISGNRALTTGLNYFWLVYNIKNTAVVRNVVDAQLLSAVIAGVERMPINGNPVGSRTIENQVLMKNGSVTTCEATFYDEGGIDGAYPDNSNKVLTINPAISGNKVRVQFTTFNVDSYASLDLLYIYDGTSISSPLIGAYSDANLPPAMITATNTAGALTFRFTSDEYDVTSGWVAQISCYQPVPMVFQSITAIHPTTATVGMGTSNNRMMRIAVNTTGELNPLSITQFNLSTIGSTNATTDISGARLYYTGNSDMFTPSNAFGTAVANPSGTFSVSGSKALQSGLNYFWLVYDIKSSALVGNVVDAQLSSAVVASTSRTPTNGNPVGSRTIANQFLMQNGSVSTCNAIFYDGGGAEDAYLNNSNQVLTVNPVVSGNKVRIKFTSFFLESNYDFLQIYDGTSINSPLIGTYSGFGLPPTITATNAAGALTFSFTSNDTVTYRGWTAQITCCPFIPKPIITVLGDTNSCGGNSVLLTAPVGYGYLWSNGETSQSITVSNAGSYTVQTLVGTCVSESSTVVRVQDVLSLLNNTILSAAPDTVVSVGQNVVLSSVLKDGNLKITEITLSRGGMGKSLLYPSWIPSNAYNFVEITNVGNSIIQLSSNSLQVYVGSSVSVNYLLPNISLNPSEVAVIHLGTGTDNPAQKYFNTGTATNNLRSASMAGFVLRNNNTQQIIDAVAANNYIFPATSGVTSADWSGSIIDLSDFAGASLQELDNNNGSSWIRSSTANPQNIGNVNPSLILNNLNLNWTGPNGFTATGSAVNTGALNTLGVHTFTASSNVGNCSFSRSIKIHVGLTSVADQTTPQNNIQVFPNPNAGDFTLSGKGIRHIELFDAQGRFVYKEIMQQPSPNSTLVQLKGVAQGVYFLKIFTPNSVAVKRLVIQ